MKSHGGAPDSLSHERSCEQIGSFMLMAGESGEHPGEDTEEGISTTIEEMEMEIGKEQDTRKKVEDKLMEELEKLKITSAERAKVVAIEDEDLEEATEDFQGGIFCRILTPKLINPKVFKTFMPKIWNKEGRVKIKAKGRNTFFCQFNNHHEKERIKRGGPW